MSARRLLVLATRNRDKARELAAGLVGLALEVRGLWEWPDLVPADETGDSLEENAVLKAEGASRHTGAWALADDTGLEVDALGGRPGVYSARYAGAEAGYEDNRRKLLEELADVPPARRTARFRTVIALARPGCPTETVEGTVAGLITRQQEGDAGFGYDPLFLYPPAGCTFARMAMESKNAVSHRGRALAALRERLGALIAGNARAGGKST